MKFLSCPLPSWSKRQIFIVLMSGAKEELRRLIKSCESTSAPVPAKQVLSSKSTNANLPTGDGSQTVSSHTVPTNESQIKSRSTYILTQKT